jgi:cell division septation protein DedD
LGKNSRQEKIFKEWENYYIVVFMQVAGFDITMEMLLIIGGTILLLMLIIIAAILLLKRRKKNAKAAQAASQAPANPEEKYRQAIIENEKEKIRQQLAATTGAGTQAQQAQPNPQPVQPQAQPSNQAQPSGQPQQQAQPAKSGEEAQIERLAALLKPKKSDYTAKEIRDTIIEGGYAEAVADEVLKRLGI